MVRAGTGILFAALILSVAAGVCQSPIGADAETTTTTLTLAQAESIAMANQPRILAAQLRSRASAQRVREARAGLSPMVAFNATGESVADTGTSTAAGAITTSSLSDRFAYGGNLVQMVTEALDGYKCA